MKLKIKKTNSDATLPRYIHEGDAGFDLHSTEDHDVGPGEQVLIKTGLQMEIPKGYWGNIRDRSGLAAKKSIHILAGVVDSSYRGEVGIVLVNHGKKKFEIKKGDRIAQMIIQPFEFCEIEEIQTISKTQRGKGGGEVPTNNP